MAEKRKDGTDGGSSNKQDRDQRQIGGDQHKTLDESSRKSNNDVVNTLPAPDRPGNNGGNKK